MIQKKNRRESKDSTDDDGMIMRSPKSKDTVDKSRMKMKKNRESMVKTRMSKDDSTETEEIDVD